MKTNLLYKNKLNEKNKNMKKDQKLDKRTKIKIILLGICTGFLSGLFASGGGLIAVPRLSLFNSYRRKRSKSNCDFLYFANGVSRYDFL